MNLDLDKKTVIITGGTGGIGKHICSDFIAEGANVIALYRNQEKYDNLVKWVDSIQLDTSKLSGKQCSILSEEELKNCMKEIQSETGSIDVLVNCAGSAHEYPFAMMNEEHIDSMMNVNLKATMMVSRSVLSTMFSQKSGVIINISSVVGSRGGRGIVAYASAKAGIDAFSRTLAKEVGRKNIRVISIRPGAIKTEMSSALEHRAGEKVEDYTALERFGTPEEISKTVVFMASNKTASFITGACIDVDGGFML